MKIFEDNKTWNEKVNFVDANNVFVGYDRYQQCCEFAGWLVSDEETISDPEQSEEASDSYEGYVFDVEYFKQTTPDVDSYSELNYVTFKIVKGDSVKYLHLFNVHNGYYDHGFTYKREGEQVREGFV